MVHPIVDFFDGKIFQLASFIANADCLKGEYHFGENESAAVPALE